jgi:hypothetical protein
VGCAHGPSWASREGNQVNWAALGGKEMGRPGKEKRREGVGREGYWAARVGEKWERKT